MLAGRRQFGWKRRLGTLAVIAVVAIGGAIVASMLEPLPQAVRGPATAVDGDTLRIGTERIRLAGIDAPELDQTCTDAAGASWPCGLDARDRLAALVEGADVGCDAEERDRYRRIVATCTVDGTDLAEAIITDGLAVGELRYSAAETTARREKRGIWAGQFEAPDDFRDRAEPQDIFALIRDWFGT